MALTGTNNEQKIWNYLKAKGLSDCGTAALMGNLYAESGLAPNNLQNTYNTKLGMTDAEYTAAVDSGKYTNFVHDSAGYGLAQWTYWSRKQNLHNFAKDARKSIGDLEMQLDFLWKELSEGYKTLLQTLKTATSILTASNAVLMQYERPADQGTGVQNTRAKYGQSYYDKYASKSTTEKEEPKVAFKMRTTKPEAGNKYYIRKASGGYSDAIKGSPTDPDCDVLANCVGYAVGRFNEIGGWGACKYLKSVNAENFIQYKGDLEVSQTPQIGACAVWQKGATLSGSDGAGHVAIVEKVVGDTEIITSESGYGSSKPFWTQTRKKGSDGNWGQGSGYKFLGFILNPAPCCKGATAGSTGGSTSGQSSGATSLKFSTGDIVNFAGGTHYSSANAASGSTVKASKAKVTNTSEGSKHPYHLRAVDDKGNFISGVYGWADENTVSAIAPTGSTTGGTSTGASGDIIYTVVKGDTLSAIASKYGTTYQKLAEYNGITNPNVINVGQKIRIPSTGSDTNAWTPQVGDIVNFTGNKHYASANATAGPDTSPCRAKITGYSKGSKHPYHLRAVNDKGAFVSGGVYGWVDAGTFTKA